MQFRNAHQRTDVFGVRSDGFPDCFHLGIVAFESFIVVLLAGGKLQVAPRYLLLKLSLAQCQFFQNALNTVQPVTAIGHVLKSLVSAYHRRTPSYR